MKYVLWVLLAIPAILLIWDLAQLETHDPDAINLVTKQSGKYAGWLIILTLCISPLRMRFPGNVVVRWLLSNRRSFGVAAFSYSVLHTAAFFYHHGWYDGIKFSIHYSILTGWVALIIMVPIAATSNNAMVRRLGPMWKKLQWYAWIAGLTVFLHWVLIHRGDLIVTALISFLPLIVLLPTRFGGRFKTSS